VDSTSLQRKTRSIREWRLSVLVLSDGMRTFREWRLSVGVLSDRMITWTVMGNLTLKDQSLHVLGHSTQLVEQRRKMWFLYTTTFSLMYHLNTSGASISQGHQLSPNNALPSPMANLAASTIPCAFVASSHSISSFLQFRHCHTPNGRTTGWLINFLD